MNEKQWTILEKLQVLERESFDFIGRERGHNRFSVLKLSLRRKFKIT